MITRDVMTKDPLTLTEQATLEDAAELMREHDIRHVPIVDRQGGLVGIVSDRDLGSLDLGRLLGDAGVEGLRAHLATPIVRVMTPEVITVGPEDGLDELVDVMLESRVVGLTLSPTRSMSRSASACRRPLGIGPAMPSAACSLPRKMFAATSRFGASMSSW